MGGRKAHRHARSEPRVVNVRRQGGAGDPGADRRSVRDMTSASRARKRGAARRPGEVSRERLPGHASRRGHPPRTAHDPAADGTRDLDCRHGNHGPRRRSTMSERRAASLPPPRSTPTLSPSYCGAEHPCSRSVDPIPPAFIPSPHWCEVFAHALEAKNEALPTRVRSDTHLDVDLWFVV